jgi:hypothetical protein
VHGHRYVALASPVEALYLTYSDFGDKKITVNAVAPGGIKTDMYHAVCREYIPNGDKLDNEGVDEVCLTRLCCLLARSNPSSTLPAGHHSTASVSPSISHAWSASWLPRTASGSTAR